MANNKRFTWKFIVPVCFRTDQSLFQETKVHVSKHISSLRLTLTDLSDPGSFSPSSISNLSNSVPNLHIFTLKELELVTRNFCRSNFLGEGGFGSVFKGFIDDKLRPGLNAQPVAVKVLDLDGTQGHREWLAEVVILGQLKHTHLVNLIGYCCENEQRMLVYEYMERGNLESLLFKGYSATLPWLTRLKIAVGAAKGLAFLHEEDKPVIYRDFKASNILLDADFNAKLSDFGLATDGPDPEGDKSHVTTRVMGTEGYAAPEYIMTGHLTTMSDVYSFGVVLLELLTGRKSVDKKRPCREQNLVKWARPLLKDSHKLDQIMDPRLEGQYSTEGARKAAEVAYQCLSHQPKSRSTMSTVVKTLEPLLDLKDIPVGSFVFIAATETKDNSITQEKHQESADNNRLDKKTCKKNGRCCHCQESKGHRHRRPIKSLKTKAAYSDTDLYRTLGTSLYSPRQ